MSRALRAGGSVFVNLLGGFRVVAPRAEDTLVLERKKTRALLAVLAVDPKVVVLAVLRLITNSNFAGRSTGISAGLAP